MPKLPVDPFTGRDFRYFPDGSTIAMTVQINGQPLWINGESPSYQDRSFFPAQQPFLWSTGPWVNDIGPPADDKTAESPIARYSLSLSRGWGAYSSKGATTEAEIWSNGLIFPLPWTRTNGGGGGAGRLRKVMTPKFRPEHRRRWPGNVGPACRAGLFQMVRGS